MDKTDRIRAFASIGERISTLSEKEFQAVAQKAQAENPWFTAENIRHALDGISRWLSEEYLISWLKNYDFSGLSPKTVGIVMAGNIPLVGFHDLMCVVLSGHKASIKASSQDTFLVQLIIRWLTDAWPEISGQIAIHDRLSDLEAVIATGSDNTSRYFEYYFRNIPHIIRKNRTSVAVLQGDETPEELHLLGQDIFWYFGLGCRNVSKVFIPEGYQPRLFFEAIEEYAEVSQHHKYQNNYDYQKSILLINRIEHLDNGFLLWQPTTQLVSPISVLFAEAYRDHETLDQIIRDNRHKIQCIVGREYVPFGQAQFPEAWDYADDVDTLKFLSEI